MALNLIADKKTRPGSFLGMEKNGIFAGRFTPDHSISMVEDHEEYRLGIWGVHDTRMSADAN